MSDVRTCGHEGDRNSIEVGARFDGVRWFLCDPCMAAMRGGDASVVGVPCMRCGKVGPVGQRFKRATLGGEEPRGYDGAFTLDPYLCVACVEREEARRAMDDDEPDPRTAHGPAWSAGTPRTAEEALLMLSQSDPRPVLRDRMHHRMQRTLGNVVLEPSPRVTPGEPMPAATMARDDWREAWRDAEVPVLCALRERCEASGARVVLPDSAGAVGSEAVASVANRYGERADRVLWHWGLTLDRRIYPEVEIVLRVTDERPRPLGQLRALLFSEGAEPQGDEASARERSRAYPMRGARGWCEGLGAAGFDSAFVAPVVAEITWQAMRLACPERVYPEPTAGESE